eukprot:TRINITY_DN1151_c0_g1_i1.p1 TRINITY_DN1151_c0_g1~~TRINITY_DN1151_c0_g1_i1.p1  ORF type:complete len:755 (-),score=134.34 TRINITY_DN1151_c0_g1_i1:2026-4290(-)
MSNRERNEVKILGQYGLQERKYNESSGVSTSETLGAHSNKSMSSERSDGRTWSLPYDHLRGDDSTSQSSPIDDDSVPMKPVRPTPRRVPQSPPVSSQERFEVIPCEYLFNRLQWYYVTVRFIGPKNNPLYVGYPVNFDNDVTFVDGRRRTYGSSDTTDSNEVLNMYISGVCSSTGRTLRKCSRCKEKDKSRVKRKRKRDDTLSWNNTDEENNSKLIQVLTSGNERVDSEGQIKFRLRVSCCVGVNKQHHMNHVLEEDVQSSETEIHRGCEGMILRVSVSRSSSAVMHSSSTKPIRVLGKVTASDRQKLLDNSNNDPSSESPTRSAPSSSSIQQPSSVPSIQSSNYYPNNSNPSISSYSTKTGLTSTPSPPPLLRHSSSSQNLHHDLPFQNNNNSNFLYQILPFDADPISFWGNAAENYRKNFDKMFSSPLQKIYEKSFFLLPNLDSLPPHSPMLSEVYSILSVGTHVSNQRNITSILIKKTTDILTDLVKSKISNDQDSILLASSLNRVSLYYGMIGDLTNARIYNQHATTVLEMMMMNVGIDVLNHPVYEGVYWLKLTFNLDLATLQNGYEWAKTRGRVHIVVHTLFLLVTTLSNPEVKLGIAAKQHSHAKSEDQKSLLIALLGQLGDLMEMLSIKSLSQGRRSYSKLVDNGFNAMKLWLNGNTEGAASCVDTVVVQVALFQELKMECYIPLFFSALVAVQLLFIDTSKYSDISELLIRKLLSIVEFSWARSLVNFLSKSLEAFSGEALELEL